MKLKAFGDSLIVKLILDNEDISGFYVETESIFVKAKVLDTDYVEDSDFLDKIIVAPKDKVNKVGLGFPSDIAIVYADDIVAFIKEDE